MANTVYMDIDGKRYPMRMTLGAMRALQEISESNRNEIDIMVDSIIVLIKQGCAYKNLFEKDAPHEENAPIVNGEYVPIEKETFMLSVDGDADTLKKLTEKFMEATAAGNQATVKSKNKAGTKN